MPALLDSPHETAVESVERLAAVVRIGISKEPH